MDNIITLTNKISDMAELQAYADQQYKTLLKAKNRIEELEREVENYKALIAFNQAQTKEPELLIKSNEQTICEVEIERLRVVVLERSLTLEETKRLDLLVKNLLLAKGYTKDITTDFKKLPKNVTEETLVSIASLPNQTPKE